MAAASPARIGEPPMCRSDRSPFDTLETTFRLLAAGPQPLALDGRTIGLAVQSIRLWELRAILFHPATGVAVQRAVLVVLAGLLERLDAPGVPSEAIAESLLWTAVRPPFGSAPPAGARPRLAAVPGG